MAKKRVYQLAKEINLASEEILEFLKDRKIPVRGIMTTVDDDTVGEIFAHFKTDLLSAQKKKAEKEKRQQIHDDKKEKKEVAIPVEEVLYAREDLLIDVPVVGPEEVLEVETVELGETVTDEIEPPDGEAVEYAAEEVEIGESAAAETPSEEVIEERPEHEEIEVELHSEVSKADELAEIEISIQVEPGAVISKAPAKEKPGKKEEAAETDEAKLTEKRRKLSKKGKMISEKILAAKAARTEGDDESEDVTTPKKSKRRKKKKKKKIDEKEIQASIRETMARMEEGTGRKKHKRIREQVEEEVETNVIKVPEFVSVAELSEMMDSDASEVIKKCLEMGLMVSINQRLDMDSIVMIADEFGFEVEQEKEYGIEVIDDLDIEDDEGDLTDRPPIVTIMGHVDHGKTSLLDYVRKSTIVAGEVGGITQHIGAYEVQVGQKTITFLDTPGHEAFTAMRARGAQATDIVVIVVAADDSVMPQTLEAIDHAKSAGVPIIFGINKVDKNTADPERIRKQLADHNILAEKWGGKYPDVEISAKTGKGVEELLEIILLQAEMMELKANYDRLAQGVVVESRLDKGRGVVATVLVQKGTLNIADSFVCGQYNGRVRAMFNERGKSIKKAGPATPAQVLGFSGLPQAGDNFVALPSEREAREISSKRQQLKREHDYRRKRMVSLDEFSKQIAAGEMKELQLIVKADTDGSAEALADSLMKLGSSEVKVNIVHRGIGAISESDVLLAAASEAIIIGFYVRPNSKTRELAEKEEVDIRLYEVIYDAISEVKDALEGLLEPEIHEDVTGSLEVREVFKISGTGNIAGCFCTSGKISRNDLIRIIRDGKKVYEGKLHSLKRFKDDAREVMTGMECGVGIENFNDIKANDILEGFTRISVKKTLQ